jgi:RND superfamily putative drug exporter
MERITRFVIARRWFVIVGWILLTMFGGFAAGQVADRFAQDFSIPGKPAYEANKRAYDEFGNGKQYPVQLVYVSTGDVRADTGIQESIDAVSAAVKNGRSRVGSFYNTQADYYVSKDGHTTYANFYSPGPSTFGVDPNLELIEQALKKSTPPGVESHVTGFLPIVLSQGGEAEGPGLLQEVMIGGVGALIVLLLIFGTVPAVLMPLMIAVATIPTTYAAVWALTYVTDVSVIVQFLIGLVGLGISIDYALLVIFRYREELGLGKDPHEALVETMTHAGHSVVVSGTTVGIGLVSMILLPVPFIRAIGIGGLLIPVVAVIATITLLPAVLSLLGTRIIRLRIPVLWRLANLDDHHGGRFWPAWSRMVTRRPVPAFLVGAILVAILVWPALDMNPSNSPIAKEPGNGSAEQGRDALVDAGFGQGVFEPLEILLEGGPSQADVDAVVDAVSDVDGVVGASAPAAWASGDMRIVQVQQREDAAVGETTDLIEEIKEDVLPGVRDDVGDGVKVTLAGLPAEDRDFLHAVYDNFPLMMTFVVGLTFILLMRALRSIVLPLKAVILNLLSLGAAYGVITFVFQQGHGSDAIWGFEATDSIVSWIPLMIFAFLFGISMDYEVFMLTRMREAYDAGHDTKEAVAIGLTRTGKLVTSGAVILMFTFIVLSTGPGPDIKEFAIGLAAGIIIDATLIRVLLVPATVTLLGNANWWFPEWARKALLLPELPPRPTSPLRSVAEETGRVEQEPALR